MLYLRRRIALIHRNAAINVTAACFTGVVNSSQKSTDAKSTVPNLKLWGKWADGGTKSYPLLAHLLDSASAAQVLFQDWMPERLLLHLNRRLLNSGGSAEQVVVTAAGLHDLGKINPIFQGQLLGSFAGNFKTQMKYLHEAGYWIPSEVLLRPSPGKEREFVSRHEVVSTVLLREDLDGDPTSFACVVGGHHGKWRMFGALEWDPSTNPVACEFYETLRNEGQWSEQAEAHRAELLEILGSTACSSQLVFDRAAVPILTAVVCLADWIASSEESITDGQQKLHLLRDDSREFFMQRHKFMQRHVLEVLGVPHKPRGTFREVFGFEPLRPVQKAMAASEHAPGLTVVMVPMGDGKTEAALGHWMLSAGTNQGLYFALPTMGTADSMFTRIQNFFSSCEDPVLGTLAHGKALLNSFYQPSRSEPNIVSADNSGERRGLTPQDWFTGRHRALLAPVTVGTIDQLLSGALRHKYNFLRLLGAATKTVVLDEVHTYDPYMSELLCGFLEWAGWLNVDVILLSATLPARRLKEYVSAYRRGQGEAGSVDLASDYPSVVRVVDGEIESIDLSESSSGREISLKIVWTPVNDDKTASTEIVSQVTKLTQLHPTAKIGVIMNTISGAQEVTTALLKVGLASSLLHARMPAFERSDRTEAAIADFGKESVNGRGILVATQVVEASIDLDFDILITQICPAASLLQRCGRVWRHDLREPSRARSRPSGLEDPLVVIVYPDPFPKSPQAFLPYLAAEIKKTVDALGNATADRINLPGDVQHLVDAADVSLAGIATAGGIAEAVVIAEKARRVRGREVRIPSPTQVTQRLTYLEAFTQGDLEDEERATRLIDRPTVTILPRASENHLAWAGPLPEKPSHDEIVKILSYTIPVSGALASTIWDAVSKGDPAFKFGVFKHRLLSEVVVVDLGETDLFIVDELLGMCKP